MNEQESFERPIDCCSCKRKLTTQYTYVQEKIVTEYYMCDDCPHLKAFLLSPKQAMDAEALSNLICANCQTSLASIQKGELLGCKECFDVFETYLFSTLKKEFSIHLPGESNDSLYKGRQKGEFKELGASERLFALNEALNEMIHKEDYEQAATIRDQIEELKKKQK